MKKIFLFLILLFLCIPTLVLADSAGPTILGYDAIVINKSGTKVHGAKEIIPYNTVVHVVDEVDGSWFSEKSDVYYALIRWENSDGYILLNDIRPYNETQEITSTESIGKIAIINKNGARLWKGTSSKYGAYDKVIPCNAKVNVTYAINYFKGIKSWYYVNDGEYKGWVASSDVDYIYQKAMLFNELKLYDSNNNLVITLPKGTVIDAIYKSTTEDKMIVEYQNKVYYVNASKSQEAETNAPGIKGVNLGISLDNIPQVLTTKQIELVTTDNKKINIPSNVRIRILYSMNNGEYGANPVCLSENECYYYVGYQNQKGFIKVEEGGLEFQDDIGITLPNTGVSVYENDYSYNYNTSDIDDKTIYSKELYDYIKNNPTKRITNDIRKKYATNFKINGDVESKKSLFQTIEENDSFYEFHLLIIKYNNDDYAVINRDYYESFNIDKAKKERNVDENNQQEEINTNNDENIQQEETTTNNNDGNKNPTSKSTLTIIYSVAAATILAIVSLITIKVINKNKKEKLSETKDVNSNQNDNKNVAVENSNEANKENIIKRDVTITKDEEIKKE